MMYVVFILYKLIFVVFVWGFLYSKSPYKQIIYAFCVRDIQYKHDFLIYDGKRENREVRNHDSDKIHVLHLKIDLLRVTKYHFSALNKKHKILTIKRIICQLVELPCWVIWPRLFIDCSPLEGCSDHSVSQHE